MFGSGRIRIGQSGKIGGILVGCKGKPVVVFEQEFQKNGAEERGEDDEHDHGYDGVDGSACEKSSFDPFVADDESDFAAGDHAAADLSGFFPGMSAQFCDASAADDFPDDACEYETQPEQEQGRRESVKTDAYTDVGKEYGREDHIGVDVDFPIDIMGIAKGRKNDSRNVCAGDVRNAEYFFCGVCINETDDEPENGDAPFVIVFSGEKFKQFLDKETDDDGSGEESDGHQDGDPGIGSRVFKTDHDREYDNADDVVDNGGG